MKDAEVAAVLEEEFLRRGVKLLKGARAERDRARPATSCASSCDDGRVVEGSHVVLAVGSIPNTDELGLDEVGVEIDDGGYVLVNHNCLLERRRTSTRPATSPGSCRCRRSRRCRAARSPST